VLEILHPQSAHPPAQLSSLALCRYPLLSAKLLDRGLPIERAEVGLVVPTLMTVLRIAHPTLEQSEEQIGRVDEPFRKVCPPIDATGSVDCACSIQVKKSP
jgi:hypothetical protein